MSRRDIIIIAVLTNIGLLAILFMMAVNPEDEGQSETSLVEDTLVSERKPIEIKSEDKVFLAQHSDVDEVDTLLKVFANSDSNDPETNETLKLSDNVTHSPESQEGAIPDKEVLHVSVKKGDVLSKIATANGTTVSQIKKLNNLTGDQLKVGQILKIPRPSLSKPSHKLERILSDSVLEDLKKGEFYEIQNGDNPWNIAKKFGISVSDLLKMNDLDEKKAKNLKIGQKIRVG